VVCDRAHEAGRCSFLSHNPLRAVGIYQIELNIGNQVQHSGKEANEANLNVPSVA
jgi:hypothetical protein